MSREETFSPLNRPPSELKSVSLSRLRRASFTRHKTDLIHSRQKRIQLTSLPTIPSAVVRGNPGDVPTLRCSASSLRSCLTGHRAVTASCPVLEPPPSSSVVSQMVSVTGDRPKKEKKTVQFTFSFAQVLGRGCWQQKWSLQNAGSIPSLTGSRRPATR